MINEINLQGTNDHAMRAVIDELFNRWSQRVRFYIKPWHIIEHNTVTAQGYKIEIICKVEIIGVRS